MTETEAEELITAVSDVVEAVTDLERRMSNVLIVANQYGMIDGAHHKQWVIDQMLRHMLKPEKYQEWRQQTPDWDEGVAP